MTEQDAAIREAASTLNNVLIALEAAIVASVVCDVDAAREPLKTAYLAAQAAFDAFALPEATND